MFFAANEIPFCERNSFAAGQDAQVEDQYTVTSRFIAKRFSPLGPKAAKRVGAQLERFGEDDCGARCFRVARVPPSQVFFRPEEVEKRSEPGRNARSTGVTRSDPYHHLREGAWGIGSSFDHERLSAMVAA